jgi:ketosteroid isomerase-like protein
VVWGRGTQSILWARGPCPAWVPGPSTSPLDRCMSRLTATFLVFVASALLASAVAADEWRAVANTDIQWRPNGAHLTLGDALHIAEAEAIRNHVRLSDFQAPHFRYHHRDDGYVWVFIYDGTVPKPGNHFLVAVNDRTQYAKFSPGE